MSEHPWRTVIALLIGAVAFGITPLALARLWAMYFSPKKPGPDKNAIYECGLESKGDAWIQFDPAYYLYAIIFLIFDVEGAFIFAWAIAHRALGWAGWLQISFFILLLLLGLFYIWRKGGLDWGPITQRD